MLGLETPQSGEKKNGDAIFKILLFLFKIAH